MRRRLALAAALLLVAPGLRAEAEVPCATATSPPRAPRAMAAAWWDDAVRRRAPAPRGLVPFRIDVVPGAGLLATPQALAAFERAAARWEAVLRDPVVVRIDADLVSLGDPGIIGATGPVSLTGPFDSIRNLLVADATLDPGDAIALALPTASTFAASLPPGWTWDGNLTAEKAALKALGVDDLDLFFGPSDAGVVFNADFAFDYDDADGIGVGLVDFESVAAHEIGHALGFLSSVDLVDQLPPGGVSPSLLDLFRFAATGAGNPASPNGFTILPRLLRPNVEAVLDDLAVEHRLSTGFSTGDGRQASHWKDDQLTGLLVGLMDPTLATGATLPLTAADVRAVDLIGWDATSSPASTTSTIPAETTTSTSTSSTTSTTAPPLRLTGKKLLLRTPARGRKRLVVVSTDAAIVAGDPPGGPADPVVTGATLRIVAASGAFDDSYGLPAGGWRLLRRDRPDKGAVFRSDGPIRLVRIEPGRRLRVVGKGSTLGPTLATHPGPVGVVLRLGIRTVCLEFGPPAPVAFVPGRKLSVGPAGAPGACPAPAEGPVPGP